VRVAGRKEVAKVITTDSVNDLALLQIPNKSSEVASLNPDLANLRQGEDVIVSGYPLNSILSSGGNLTLGTVSALTGLGNNTSQMQITAPIQPGSSGSPVLNRKGNVIGVVSMKLDDGYTAKITGQIPQNVNFAITGQTTRTFP
jgi:S1-C subfamily serine protease